MVSLILFSVCLLASTAGAIVGIGGGVIIKPVVDLLGILPVSTVSFCSGCTVLCMACASLLRNRRDGIKLQFKISTALAIGAVGGGLLGKWLFDLLRTSFKNDNTLGAIQSVCLMLITLGVFLYICRKRNLQGQHIDNTGLTIGIGAVLGIISSFLGIGGGPCNIAVLSFFFSMDAKTAAKNSLYIIIFSQVSSIFSAFLSNSIPAFQLGVLLCMVAGGVGGALMSAAISKRIDNKGVESIFKMMLLLIALICLCNTIKFLIS